MRKPLDFAAAVIVVCGMFAEVETVAFAASASPLKLAITIEPGPDRGQNLGSLFEIVNADGHVIAGAGFLGAYNTQPRSDRTQLQFFTRTPAKSPQRKVERLPAIESPNRGYYPFVAAGNLYVVGRGGPGNQVYRWDERQKDWTATNEVPAYQEHVADKPLVFTSTIATFDGRPILDVSNTNERLGEHYYANGHLIVRQFAPSAQPPTNRLVVYTWEPESDEAPKAIPDALHNLTLPQEFIYAFGQWHDHILAVSNYGAVLPFDGTRWSILRPASPGVSFQIYAALNYFDRLLLGQYPTGELFEYAGDALKHLPKWPPRIDGASANAREAQTLAIYGGELYAGVWPWGEFWRYDRDRWHFVQRMFTHPTPSAEHTHPYERETAAVDKIANLWGQRVTGLVPFGGSLIITTSSKSGAPWEPRFNFLTPEQQADYGAIYRATIPGQIAVATRWSAGPTQFEFSLNEDCVTIKQDDSVLGTLPLDRDLVAQISKGRVVFGQGVFGPLRAKLVNKASSFASAEVPASFRAAYVHPDRFFSAQSTADEQRVAWRKLLDDCQRVGLNVVCPYFCGSSGQAYYASQLLPRQVYANSDPMPILMQEARQRGLLVYPVVCVTVSGGEQPAGILLQHPEWGLRHPDGTPLGYISPAHPAARDWLAAVPREIASNYHPDGIILDYIRYHNRPLRLDAASETRFRATLPPNCPTDEEALRLQKFKEDELTTLVEQISQAVRETQPTLRLGAYVWGPHTRTNHLTAQVWPRWLDAGHLDLINVSGYCYRENCGPDSRRLHFLGVCDVSRHPRTLATLRGQNVPCEKTLRLAREWPSSGQVGTRLDSVLGSIADFFADRKLELTAVCSGPLPLRLAALSRSAASSQSNCAARASLPDGWEHHSREAV